MKNFFDHHTHSDKPFSCRSCRVEEFLNIKKPLEGQNFSLQLHPWHLPENFTGLPENFIKLAKSDQICAIGEIGLDRLHGPALDIQIKYFKAALDLANELKKPVILHIVRCGDEALRILENYPHLKKIWHGFRGKKELFRKIVDANIFVLLHPAMLDNDDFVCYLKEHSCLSEQIGLESDDSDIDLQKLYTTLEKIFYD